MWRASILALVGLLLATTGADARVLQTVTPADRLAEGPLLAGNRVAWEENRCASSGGCGFEADTRYRIRAAGPGGIRTLRQGRIRSLPGGSNSFFSSISFDLSPSRFVLARSEFGTTNEQEFAAERLFAGDRRGDGLTQLFACATDRQSLVNAFALAGDRVAYDPDPCDARAVIEVRALGAGSTKAIDLGNGMLEDVALAGRFVASAHAGRVRVHNANSGAELFSAPLPPGTLHGIDVAADGRLAVSVGSQRIGRRSCWRSRLWLRDAGGGSLQLKRPQPCWDARLSRDGVVFLRGGRHPSRLELLSPGGSGRVIVDFGSRPVWESFDARHMRAAFAARCDGRMRIRVVSLGAPARAC
jgi:hypothetical protein